MAILSGREKPLANDGRAGHLRGANSAADLFDKRKASSDAPLAHTVFCKWSVALRKRSELQLLISCIVASFAVQTSATAGQERLTIHAGKRSSSPRSQPI